MKRTKDIYFLKNGGIYRVTKKGLFHMWGVREAGNEFAAYEAVKARNALGRLFDRLVALY
ncbi:hypothetical protein IJV57_00380 [Candidatus Saccharibacteria bacterium]|nr:hypothetical protein [Candidatus Saccharibacteria bacterium]